MLSLLLILNLAIGKRIHSNSMKAEFDEKILLYTVTPNDDLSEQLLRIQNDKYFPSISFKLIDCIENKYYCEDEGISSFPAIYYTNTKEKFYL